MRLIELFKLVSFSLLASLSLGSLAIHAQTPAPASPPVSVEQRESIEKIIREYLVTHPEVLREAMQALQEKEEIEKQRVNAENIEKLRSEIYADADAPVIGNAKGDVTIVVFYDYFCGYCRSTIPGLTDLATKDPGLKIIYKEFPILGPDSLTAAKASLAADRQGKFAAFHRAMLAADAANEQVIKSLSEKVGLDYARLKKDMADPKIDDALARNVDLASSLSVDGTPAYLIGDKVIPGAISTEALANIIAAKRSKKEIPIVKTGAVPK